MNHDVQPRLSPRGSGVLFVALALWLVLLGILAGAAVSIDAFPILGPWAVISALVGLALMFVAGRWLPALIGAVFGVASAGFGLVMVSQSSADFYFMLAIVIGLSIGGAVGCVRLIRSQLRASPV
jgi:hypothetical protein